MRFGELIPGRFRPAASPDSRVGNSQSEHIKRIIVCASHVWFDRGDRKEERFQEQARQLLEYLTPAVVSNPDFYQKIDGATHIRVLGLLGTFVPSQPEELAEFMQDTVHGIIVSYLQGIVSHRVTITEPTMNGSKTVVDGNAEDYQGKIASYLLTISAIPRHYLHLIYPTIGLALPPKSQSFSW